MDKKSCKKNTNTVYLLDTEIFSDSLFIKKALEVLPKKRREETEKISGEIPFAHSLCGGVLLSFGLSECGIKADGLEYLKKERGKPFLPSLTGLHFSISHSGRLAVCAFSDKEVGADIEQIRSDRRDLHKLSERYFSKGEAEYLSSLGEEERCEDFFRIWCLKESAVKLSGEGISDIRRYECFDVKEKRASEYIYIDGEERGYFTEFSLDRYRVAVCSRSDADFSLREVTADEIEEFIFSPK